MINCLFLLARQDAGPRGAQEETCQEVSTIYAHRGMSVCFLLSRPVAGLAIDRLAWVTCGELSTLAPVDGHVAGVRLVLVGFSGPHDVLISHHRRGSWRYAGRRER